MAAVGNHAGVGMDSRSIENVMDFSVDGCILSDLSECSPMRARMATSAKNNPVGVGETYGARREETLRTIITCVSDQGLLKPLKYR